MTIVKRLWDRDFPKGMKEWLGWLNVAEWMKAALPPLELFVKDIKSEIDDVVLLGMGGSSLAPEVFGLTFGSAPGFPKLHILDTTDPAAILHVEQQLDLRRTLFVVSSKSGGTVETDSLFKYFYEKIPDGRHFIAITDPQTSLDKLGQEKKFRQIFLNPADIGGRYSALSYFGAVPAALIGVDLIQLLNHAISMMKQCQAPVEQNPGAQLGLWMAEYGLKGKDKVTLMAEKSLSSFGSWVEQLLAESTGKEGKGLIPIDGETPGDPDVYGADRLFVYLSVRGENQRYAEKVVQLEKAGFPVTKIVLENKMALGGEFFKWEFATAVAGEVLKINAFDQPNVQESKDNTKALLQIFVKDGKLPPPPAADANLETILNAKPGDYVALMAYIERSAAHDEMLQRIRIALRDRLKVATTLGYGPRFLHSTGQLHKGGPNSGIFIQFTAKDEKDISIPGAPYTFSTLKQAQALGDLQSLIRHGRRVIHINLGTSISENLDRFLAVERSAKP